MSLHNRFAMAIAVLFLLWTLWPVIRRSFCSHSSWRTLTTVAGFGVPILDQRCRRCGMPRRIQARSFWRQS